MSKNISRPSSRLNDLANFRYELRRFLSFSEKASVAESISVQQYQLLQVIAAVPDGEEPSVSLIAERMVLRHNSAVELVDRAARSGLVRRKVDPEDLRRSLVELTPKGAEVLARLVSVHLAELNARGYRIERAIQSLLTPSEAE